MKITLESKKEGKDMIKILIPVKNQNFKIGLAKMTSVKGLKSRILFYITLLKIKPISAGKSFRFKNYT